MTLTEEEGRPFFHDDYDAVLHPRESYATIPQLPPRVVDFLGLGSGQESHFDFPSPDDRRLICARKSSCLPDREKPYVGVVLEADYDELMTEPMQLRRWVAGITLGVVVALMVVGWIVVRVITLLARG